MDGQPKGERAGASESTAPTNDGRCAVQKGGRDGARPSSPKNSLRPPPEKT